MGSHGLAAETASGACVWPDMRRSAALACLGVLVATSGPSSGGSTGPAHVPSPLPKPLRQATLMPSDRGRLASQLQTHGFALIEPSAGLVRAVEAAEQATASLFGLDTAVKAHIDEASRAPNTTVLRAIYPELAALTESCIGLTGLRLRPAACSATNEGGSDRKSYHEQFHAVVDPATMDALRWPEAEQLPSSFRDAVQGAVDELQSLSQQLLRVVAPELLHAWQGEVALRGNPSVIDLFRYDGCKGSWWSVGPDGDKRMEPECWTRDESRGDLKCCEDAGMSEHVDPGILTCKYVGDRQVAGLELLDRASGAWFGETLFRGSVVCFVNEALADWTLARQHHHQQQLPGDEEALTATSHRVVPSGATPRLSVVYEMRGPEMDGVWGSAKERSKARRAQKKREAKALQRRRGKGGGRGQ
jgi:isopenicillin N synthase-like dioxygenase